MPQLDTIFISLIFMCTWLTLQLAMKKTASLLMVLPPKNYPPTTTNKHTPTLPWT